MNDIDPGCKATAEIYWWNGYIHGLDLAYTMLKRLKADWKHVFWSAKYREDLEGVMEVIAAQIVNSDVATADKFLPEKKP